MNKFITNKNAIGHLPLIEAAPLIGGLETLVVPLFGSFETLLIASSLVAGSIDLSFASFGMLDCLLNKFIIPRNKLIIIL